MYTIKQQEHHKTTRTVTYTNIVICIHLMWIWIVTSSCFTIATLLASAFAFVLTYSAIKWQHILFHISTYPWVAKPNFKDVTSMSTSMLMLRILYWICYWICGHWHREVWGSLRILTMEELLPPLPMWICWQIWANWPLLDNQVYI